VQATRAATCAQFGYKQGIQLSKVLKTGKINNNPPSTMVSEILIPTQQQQPPPNTPPHQNSTPDSTVYTSLIQTYLNLLHYDNATFLAERYAAFHPNDENAIYFLAYCHYRRGETRAARSVLLTRWIGRDSPEESRAKKVDEEELMRVRNSARYLLATCCYDLGLYGEAEEAMLRCARERFGREATGGGSKIRGNVNEVMDAWILQTDVSFICVFSFWCTMIDLVRFGFGTWLI
jgi:TolA-binding protein